jgi:ComF family protein
MVLDLLFPRACAACGDGPWPFCSACRVALTPIDHPLCSRCGAPARAAVDRCELCPPPDVDRARSAFVFRGPLRKAIHRLKFAGDRGVAAALGGAMAAVLDREPDVITWVPLSRARWAERGYDQARALARTVSRLTRTPVSELLSRSRDLPPQALRGATERRSALTDAFSASRRPPPHVLLVDDVMTTGATAAECAKALKIAGAAGVEVLTAGRALRRARGVWGEPVLSSDGLRSGSVVARGEVPR